MSRIAYIEKDFRGTTLDIIDTANDIIAAYEADGYSLTLRQLYYQFVSRDLIPNTQRDYKRLGSIINDARLAGMIDWDAIEDRTRATTIWDHWSDPSDIVNDAAGWFRLDRWDNQPYRVEIWIEKEALAGVFHRVCARLDVPFLSCRGYTSQSEMHKSARRLADFVDRGQQPVILHFGDHDPSGVDMSRDIIDRMRLFDADVVFERLALNRDQIDQYKPPPNPAKITDSRATAYIAEHGRSSWELDALEPRVLVELVEQHVAAYRDDDAWAETMRRETAMRDRLRGFAKDVAREDFD